MGRLFSGKAVAQSFMYMGIGAIASGVDAGFYLALTRALGFRPVPANFISVNLGITISFLLNSFFNFRKTGRMAIRAVSFYGICYLGLMISMTLLWAGTSLAGLPDIPVKACAMLAAGTMQFLFNKFVTFGKI